MENTIHEMENEGVQSYILDLRNNPVNLHSYFFALIFLVKFLSLNFFSQIIVQGGLVKAGLDVAEIWLDGNETLVNTVDRDGHMSPINMINSHAVTHDPLVVLVSVNT